MNTPHLFYGRILFELFEMLIIFEGAEELFLEMTVLEVDGIL